MRCMSTTHALSKNAAVLAVLLERMEARGQADAHQYQDIARRLAAELADVAHDTALDTLLDSSPAAAAIYENLNYAHAGLCRSLLDASLHSELTAREAIFKARRTSETGPAPRAA